MILWGKKRTALIIGKTQVFSTRSYVYLPSYTQIGDRGTGGPAPIDDHDDNNDDDDNYYDDHNIDD